MHTTVSTVIQCLVNAGVTITTDERARFVHELESALGGGAVYFPKRAARPCGMIAMQSGYSVQSIRAQYGVSRATAYRWIGRK